MFLQAHMGTLGWNFNRNGSGSVFSRDVRSESPVYGGGKLCEKSFEKLRGRETMYLAGLEAVGITSANVPICVPPILGRVVHIRSCKGKQEEEPKHGVREFGLIPCCYSHLWLALGQASSLMPSIRSFNNCFPPLRQHSALIPGPHIYTYI